MQSDDCLDAKCAQDESQQLPPWIASACSSVVGQRFSDGQSRCQHSLQHPGDKKSSRSAAVRYGRPSRSTNCVLHKYALFRVPLEVV